MPSVQVKKVVAVCFLEAAKITFLNLVQRLAGESQGGDYREPQQTPGMRAMGTAD